MWEPTTSRLSCAGRPIEHQAAGARRRSDAAGKAPPGRVPPVRRGAFPIFPAVDRGVQEAADGGFLAGFPVVDFSITLLDGKEHAVDSSELAFKLAARGAFREAMNAAGPVLLEPVMNLRVFVEEKNLGDVMSDLSGRRGRISGQNPLGGGIVEIDSQAPQAELLRYAIDLRSMTSGTGSFEVEFDHYAPITGKIAEDVVKAAAAFKVHEEEEE
ncbi:MAG: hypothetical protein HGA47_09985 [Zoogloea sp.]|nr:hypothetical protein [Zoogloea sp.]